MKKEYCKFCETEVYPNEANFGYLDNTCKRCRRNKTHKKSVGLWIIFALLILFGYIIMYLNK